MVVFQFVGSSFFRIADVHFVLDYQKNEIIVGFFKKASKFIQLFSLI